MRIYARRPRQLFPASCAGSVEFSLPSAHKNAEACFSPCGLCLSVTGIRSNSCEEYTTGVLLEVKAPRVDGTFPCRRGYAGIAKLSKIGLLCGVLSKGLVEATCEYSSGELAVR